MAAWRWPYMIVHEYPGIELIKIWNAKKSYAWQSGDGPYI